MIKEIEDDIIGPRLGPEEEINANPTSEYLAGILHPKQTKVSSEDDETTSTEMVMMILHLLPNLLRQIVE